MSYQERIRPREINISDALRGCLPTIDVLKQDYADMTAGLADPVERAENALRLSCAYREAADPSYLRDNSEVYGQDVVAALFLESTNMVASQKRAEALRLRPGYSYGTVDPRFLGFIRQKLEARERLMEQLDGYIEVFRIAGEEKLYDGLESILYEAKCLIENAEDLDKNAEHEVGSSLVGMLAEYKVITALRSSGWPLARHSSPTNDMEFGVDIELPIGNWNQLKSLPISVKAKKGGDTSLDISINRYGVVVIKVPMSKKYGKRLTLTTEQSRQLARSVRRILAVRAAGQSGLLAV